MAEDITGRRYGKITVIKKSTSRFVIPKGRKNNRGQVASWWLCQCDCGNMEVFAQAQLSGHYISKCSKCKELDLIERQYKISPKTGRQIERPSISIECMDRSKIEKFVKYYSLNPLLFQDTFCRPFSEEIAQEEFKKIMGT